MNFFRGKVIPGSRLGLSTSCSRFSKKFPVISQKVAQALLTKQSKVAFCNESCSSLQSPGSRVQIPGPVQILGYDN